MQIRPTKPKPPHSILQTQLTFGLPITSLEVHVKHKCLNDRENYFISSILL